MNLTFTETNMTFDTFVEQAWNDHATAPESVASRLAQGLTLAQRDDQLPTLAHLGVHVLLEHLGDWQRALTFVEQLSSAPLVTPASACVQSLLRYSLSCRLAGGEEAALDGLGASDQVRVAALASGALVLSDTSRANALLTLALETASALADTDPANRSLAVTGNNMACTLEEKKDRTHAQQALMILAATTARTYWERAGTWLEVERAQYRLAMTWLAAGDVHQARLHAQACREIVEANGNVPLESFFAHEALAKVEREAGNPTGLAVAVAAAAGAYAGLEESDKGWCKASLDMLSA